MTPQQTAREIAEHGRDDALRRLAEQIEHENAQRRAAHAARWQGGLLNGRGLLLLAR
jgi:hypothetical protein